MKMFRYDDTDDDAFDDNGLLRDGETHRVRLQMRNSTGHVLTDGLGQSIDPRARRAGFVFASDAGRDDPARAIDHAVRRAQTSAAWRGGLVAGDEVIVDGERFRVLGYDDADKMVLGDAVALDREAGLDADALKQQAYEAGVAEMTDAWKRKPPPDEDDDEEEGGERKKKNRSDREFELAGPLSDADIRAIDEIKRAAYLDSVADLQNAWRK